MKRWLRISLWAVAGLTGVAIITFAAFVWLFLVPSRTYPKIGGRWSRHNVFWFTLQAGVTGSIPVTSTNLTNSRTPIM